MYPRAVAVFCLSLLSAASAMAQAPPPAEAPPAPGPPPAIGEPQPLAPPPSEAEPGEPQSGRVFCGQSINFRLADPSSVPDDDRRYVGVWSDAAWDAHTCAALVVTDVKADGTASIIYIYGPQGSSSPVPGGVLRGTGVIRGGELRFQNSDGSQFAFRPGIVDMTGHLIDPKGESFEAIFKQTP
jgi:hypothetical protein